MDKIFAFLMELSVTMYEVDHSDLYSGWIYGCECGCGGDTYSDNPDLVDDMYEYEEDFKESMDALMLALDVDEDYIREALTSLICIEDKPDPEDTWYSDHCDYTSDLDYWSHSVESYAPFVADIMQRMEARGIYETD